MGLFDFLKPKTSTESIRHPKPTVLGTAKNGFDAYSTREVVEFPSQSFESLSFEIWSGGKMLNSSKNKATIITIEQRVEGGATIYVLTTGNEGLDGELPKVSTLDTCYTSGDRILLATIPKQSNVKDNDSYIAFIEYSPFTTRDRKTFSSNEPSACSLFTKDGILKRIAFTIPISRKLVEFNIPI